MLFRSWVRARNRRGAVGSQTSSLASFPKSRPGAFGSRRGVTLKGPKKAPSRRPFSRQEGVGRGAYPPLLSSPGVSPARAGVGTSPARIRPWNGRGGRLPRLHRAVPSTALDKRTGWFSPRPGAVSPKCSLSGLGGQGLAHLGLEPEEGRLQAPQAQGGKELLQAEIGRAHV